MLLKQALSFCLCAILATICQIPGRQLLSESPQTSSSVIILKTLPITIITTFIWTRLYRRLTGESVNRFFNVAIDVSAPMAANYVNDWVLKPRQAAYDYRVIHAHVCHDLLHLRNPQKLQQNRSCRQRWGMDEVDARKRYRTVTRQRDHSEALSYDRVKAEECVTRKQMSLTGECCLDQYTWEKQRLTDMILPCYHAAGINVRWEEKAQGNDSTKAIQYLFPFPLNHRKHHTHAFGVQGVQTFEAALDDFDKIFFDTGRDLGYGNLKSFFS